MTIKQAMRTVGVALGAFILCTCANATAYGQNDRSDRPDSQDVGPSQRERTGDKQATQAQTDEDARKQTLKYSRTRRLGNSGGIQTLTLTPESGNPHQETLDRATAGYQTFLTKFGDAAYANSHVKLRFEDFAPAYFIVLNAQVGDKVGNGFALAEKRAQLRSYKKILREDTGLDEKTAAKVEQEAKQLLKSFRQ